MADTHWLWVQSAVVVLILKKDLQIILRLLDVVASLFPAFRTFVLANYLCVYGSWVEAAEGMT